MQYLFIFETMLVFCIMAAVIYAQVRAFRKNRVRINDFGTMFSRKDTWHVYHDKKSMASGIASHGNNAFNNMASTINKYLENSNGSALGFSQLKDVVDRNCDAAEDEINAQISIPLYYGLAGTVAGVIICLVFVLTRISGSVVFHDGCQIEPSTTFSIVLTMTIAVTASLVGIVLTMWNVRYFKEKKAIEERDKIDFLVWIQTKLLPALPADVGEAMQGVVANLNHFNTVFATNNNHFKETLSKISSLYQEQGEILKLIHDTDMQEMATANVNVLHELQSCTGRLDKFNEYLTAVKGYASEIYKFREQLAREQERLCVLEEIRDFFRNHGYKDALAKTISDCDDSMRTALRNLQKTTSDNMDTISHMLTRQTETFLHVSQEMQDAFESQLHRFPQLEEQIRQIALMPALLEKLAKEIENSNSRMANSINYALQNIRVEFGGDDNSHSNTKIPRWLPVLLAVIAIFAAMPYIIKTVDFIKDAF